MEVLKIGICDDEQSWLQKEQEMLENYARKVGCEIEVTAFQSEQEILSYDGPPLDAVFMDIELENANGIQVSSVLNEKWKGCAIVYVTNYLFYATDTYQTEHVYFVLKEQFEKRLEDVLAKILHLCEQKEKKWKFEVIGGSSREVLLSTSDILYFERDMRRTRVHTVWGEYDIWEKIGELEKRFAQKEFVRCHNSYIVNLTGVREISSTCMIMNNGAEIPISRFYAAGVKKKFAAWAVDEVI